MIPQHQTPLWVGDNHGTVNFFDRPDPLEDGKIGPNQTINLEQENFDWLDDLATATGKGRSTWGRIGIKFFRIFFKHHREMVRYRKAIISLIESLSAMEKGYPKNF